MASWFWLGSMRWGARDVFVCVMVVMVSVCFPTVLFGCRLVY